MVSTPTSVSSAHTGAHSWTGFAPSRAADPAPELTASTDAPSPTPPTQVSAEEQELAAAARIEPAQQPARMPVLPPARASKAAPAAPSALPTGDPDLVPYQVFAITLLLLVIWPSAVTLGVAAVGAVIAYSKSRES